MKVILFRLKKSRCLMLVLICVAAGFTSSTKAETIRMYVCQDKQESQNEEYLFNSLQAVMNRIKELRNSGNTSPIHVSIASWKYVLDETIYFTAAHNSLDCGKIILEGEGDVTLTGGRKIKGWRLIADNHWVVTLPEVKEGSWFFRQLFWGEQRLTRARTPNSGFLLTNGPLSKYEKEISKYTWDSKQKENNPGAYWESRCGFSYRGTDMEVGDDWKNAEILTYHSWESSWQSPLAIDIKKKDVYFSSPCRYPIGTFGKSMRYRIENVKSAMDLPGEWYLDKAKGELHYLANQGEDPNTMDIYAPHLKELLVCKGTPEEKVHHLEFRNINFYYADYGVGIYDIAPNWPQEIQDGIPYFPKDQNGGYTDAQAAPRCGQAIDFLYASNVLMEKCRINHVGANAVRIGKGSSGIELNGCEIYDVGGGGVYIGFPTRDVIADRVSREEAPYNNRIRNCLISDVGLVHPAAVGVWLAQTYNNTIEKNELAYISNSGVSLGWSWGKEENYTKDNIIRQNYIHHVAQFMGDAAGLYSLGNCKGSVYEGNYLDQINKGEGVHGVVDAMGFDGSSYYITIKNNVVGRISGKVASFAREGGPQYQTWEGNNFDLEVERPVFEHEEKLDPTEFTAYAEFDPVSSFLNLEGWLEQKWVFSKNGSGDKDGFYGVLVQGKQVVGYLNAGGGKENIHTIASKENVLIDDQTNKVALTYGDETMRLYFNGELVGEKYIGKERSGGTGKLAIAPISANSLRKSVDLFVLMPTALAGGDLDNIRAKTNTANLVWRATKKKFSVNEKRVIKNAGPDKTYYKRFVSSSNREKRK